MGYDDALIEARSILATGERDAAQHAEAILVSFAESTENHREKGLVFENIAICSAQSGKVRAAMDWFTKAEALLSDPVERLVLFEEWATVVYRTGRFDFAETISEQLKKSLSDYPDVAHSVLPFAYGALARIQVMLEHMDHARKNAETAIAMASMMKRGLAEAYSTLSVVCEADNDIIGAMESLQTAMEHMNSGRCLLEAHSDYARLAILAGDCDSACQHMKAALDLPDPRDHHVLAKFLKANTLLMRVDAEQAVKLNERLAAFLEQGIYGREVKI